ncbi:MAG: glycoside hydrolase family 15 protein [Nannocystaceae bacterium]
MPLEDLAIVGNCQISALIDRFGTIVWSCFPRFDAEPLFGALLDDAGGGHFAIAPASGRPGTQSYLENTNVLVTTFRDDDGSFRILDFAPRFVEHARPFRPTQLMRIVEPLSGAPRIRVRCDPRLGWSRRRPLTMRGSNHLSFAGFANPLRLTTDVPISHLDDRPFSLAQRQHLALTWGEPIEAPLSPVCERFLDETVRYWRQWVKHCNVPPRFQDAVIRSALTLKLHCFEDTGAIIAATSCSIPEAPGTGRTWDYRYCWLRDAYYVVGALQRLGHFEERESFMHFLLDRVADTPELALKPLYRIDGASDLEERVLADWPGYRGDGPVRVGNAAAAHAQHDVFGEMVLALMPVLLDRRFGTGDTATAFDAVARLARKALAVAGTPDAGIWEYRNDWVPQTFSAVMCWAAADRAAAAAVRHAPELAPYFRDGATRLRDEILACAWSPARNSFVASYGGGDLDASLLQMAALRFLPPTDPRLRATVDTIARELDWHGWLLRYAHDDGLGRPQVPFVICTFWLVEALALLGEHTRAETTLQRVLDAMTPLGLMAEDYDPVARTMAGNFPQAYSHVGLIHAAFAASPRWAEVL